MCKQGFGSCYLPDEDRSVRSVVEEISRQKGILVRGRWENCMERLASGVLSICNHSKISKNMHHVDDYESFSCSHTKVKPKKISDSFVGPRKKSLGRVCCDDIAEMIVDEI